MIYLRDLRVEVERARDLRSVRVTVLDNDALPDGEHPPLAGARVTLHGRGGAVIAESRTPETGRVAFATPADVSDAELTVSIELKGFNTRKLRADGTSLAKDIRQILYANRRRSNCKPSVILKAEGRRHPGCQGSGPYRFETSGLHINKVDC